MSNNGTKATPALAADIFGDWREEVIFRTRDNNELRIFSTPIPTDHRLVTLMQDPQYRLGIAWQNVGYNQPAYTGCNLYSSGNSVVETRTKISDWPTLVSLNISADMIRYHIRNGKHDITLYTWNQYMDFANRVLK